MSYQTKPGYTADTQANITAQVPDVEDGAIAFAIAEQTSWQLSKTSAATLGIDAIATKSGVGRWLRLALASSVPTVNSVSFDADFGPPGQIDYNVPVTVAAPWITASSFLTFRFGTTADHSPEDASLEYVVVTVLSISPGVGFDAVVSAQGGSFGVYNIIATGFLPCPRPSSGSAESSPT